MKPPATLAGGCFCGMQNSIRKMPGVTSTRVGYSGGDVPNATYRHQGMHAHAIEIVFDLPVLSYRDLLAFFFQIHDPTTPDRQGNDRSTAISFGIHYASDAQRQVALDTIADVEASGLWPGKVVTEITYAGPLWRTEPDHQDYLERVPNGYTCHYVRPTWKLPHRTTARIADVGRGPTPAEPALQINLMVARPLCSPMLPRRCCTCSAMN